MIMMIKIDIMILMEMKKELLIGGLISLTLVVLAIFYTMNYKTKRVGVSTSNEPEISNNTSGSSTKTAGSQLTAAEVAKHKTAGDCWIVINTKVLAVSKYLNLHPGGGDSITPYCGKDATSAFNSIKGGRGHSNKATSMFADFLVGVLGQSISPTEKAKLTQTPVIERQNNDNNFEEREDD